MSISDRKNNIIRWSFLGVILLLGTISMILVTLVDFEWTKYLYEHRIVSFKDWMADSVFEGEMIGGSDLPIFFIIVSAFVYIIAWTSSITNLTIRSKFSFLLNFLGKRPRLKDIMNLWRPLLGFVLASSICIGMFIHSLKWSIGRARPKYVIEKGMAYSEWYGFGPYFVADGPFRGSFPSGHTGTVILLMVLAYILFFNTKSLWLKFFGIISALLTLSSAMLMLLARSMSFAHWISDSVMSIVSGWLIVHLLYFWILKIPKQREYLQKNEQPMPLPFFFAIRLCLTIFPVILGVMAVIIGLRALYLQNCPWLATMVPVGVFLVIFFLRLCIKLNRKLG